MTAARRQYTRRQKATLVGEAEVNGVRPTARKHHVPASTLEHWRQTPDMARLRAEKKDEVASDVFAGFQVGVRRIIELLPTTADIAKVAVATGILYDKYALMSGQATHRTESRDLADSLDDHERETLRKVIDDALTEVPA